MKNSRYLAAGAMAIAIGFGGFLAWQSFGVRDAAPAVAYTLLFGWLLLWRMRIARMEATVAEAERHAAFAEE